MLLEETVNEFPSKGWSRSGLDSLLRRIDARGNTDRKFAWGLGLYFIWTTL